nr:basic proline-rich protein-like [Macaca fascicularis]
MTYSSRLPHTTTRRLDAGYMQRDRDVTLQQPRGKTESVPGAGCGLAIQAHERIQEAVLKTCREVFSNGLRDGWGCHPRAHPSLRAVQNSILQPRDTRAPGHRETENGVGVGEVPPLAQPRPRASAGPPPCPRTSPPGRSLTDLARPAPGCSLRPPPTAQARGRPVPKASGPRVPRPPRPPLPPERRGELGPEPATTAATSGPHSPGPPPGAEAGTARSAAPRPPALPARGGARCGARQGARGGPAGSAARRGSLRAEDLTPGPPPRSPPGFHFPRHPQPVWRRRRRRRRLLRGLQGIPGRPRRREERAGPTHSPASPAGPGPQPQRGERGDAAPRPPGRCPASSRRRGECPASRRRRLSPAVTARRGCVCLQLLQSLLLLPTPPRGPGARPGRGGPGRRAGARGSPAHEPRRPLLGAGPEAGGGRWERCAARRPRDPGLHSRPGLGPAWRAPTAGRTGNSRSSAESAAGVPGGAGSPPAGRGRSREAEGALEHRVPRGLRVHHGRGTSGSRLEMRSRAAGHLVGREMAPTQKVRWNLRAVTLSPGRTYICEDHLRLDLHLSADKMPFCSEVHALPPANPTMFDGGLVTAGAYGHFNPILL